MNLIYALLIGLSAGLLAALAGVGGGVLLVPAFTSFFQLDQKSAVATSLAVIIISATTTTLNHTLNRSGLIDWRVVGLVALGVVIASWFGSDLMRTLSNQLLTRLFAILLIGVAVRMLMRS